MSRHFQQCYEYGRQQEGMVFPIIQEYFSDNIERTKGQYAKHDYSGDTANYELKSRKNKCKTYPTTMITYNKISIEEKDLILIFNFLDGLYYIKYEEELFSTFFTQPFARDGCTAVPLEHIYIPINKLTAIKVY